MAQCELFLTAPNKNILTYLLTYLLTYTNVTDGRTDGWTDRQTPHRPVKKDCGPGIALLKLARQT